MKTKAFFLFCCCVLFSFVSKSQEIEILPAFAVDEVKLKVLSNDKCISANAYLGPADEVIEVKAYATESWNDQELKVPLVEVDLVRRGMIVDRYQFSGKGKILHLIKQAKPGDQFIFSVNKLLIPSGSNTYEIFTTGRVSFFYEYESSGILVLN